MPRRSHTAESNLHALVQRSMELQRSSVCVACEASHSSTPAPKCLQVTKYVQREILNHRRLIHPHIVEMREVTVRQQCVADRSAAQLSLHCSRGTGRRACSAGNTLTASDIMHDLLASLPGGAAQPTGWRAVLQVFLTPDYLAITMEYASGGDLFSLVGRSKGLSEADARWYFQQLVISIDYCHRMVRRACFPLDGNIRLATPALLSGDVQQWTWGGLSRADACGWFGIVQGVANRDIKLENALLDSNPRPLLKICDFGYSKVCCL
jgi:serine/threonine protein kinase